MGSKMTRIRAKYKAFPVSLEPKGGAGTGVVPKNLIVDAFSGVMLLCIGSR
jgi:anti-sigma-K factor RskA